MITFDCDGVLFDCDGVLVDSDESVISAWSRWAEVHQLDPAQVVSTVHGRRSADTVAAFIAPDHRSAALAQIDRYEIEDAAAVTAIAGARELTQSIPLDRWAVVTSGTTALANARLRAAHLRVPYVLITADTVERGKPDPEGYATAAERLGIPPARCIVLEDAVAGIRAARAAGVQTVIGVGERGLEDDADVVIADLNSLRWSDGGLIVEERP